MRPIRLAVLCMLAAAPALAQTVTPGSGPYIAGGIEAIGFRDGSTTTPGLTLQAGYTFALLRSPVSLRVEVGWFDRSRASQLSSGRANAGSVNLEMAYRLGRGRTQPYLIGGLGINRLYLGQSSGGYGLGGLGGGASVSLLNRTTVSALGGIGAQRRVLGLWLFSEARYIRFLDGAGFARHILPVTFGIRF